MAEPNIVLTGFMATGKTTVGKMLAQQLGYEFLDTDDIIVQRAGKSVARIFQDQGEPVFRQMEADLAVELAQKQKRVISTGGGMLMNPDNAEVLGRTGRIFCLTATPEEIYHRLIADQGARRPLVDADDPMAELTRILDHRKKSYAQFLQIKTSSLTPEQVVSHILDCL